MRHCIEFDWFTSFHLMQLLFFILYACLIVRERITVELFKVYLGASARMRVKLKD